jgi:Demethylmenaquinone methyltransferase
MVADTPLTPLKADVLDKLRQVSTSTLATQLYRRGFRQPTLIGLKLLSNVVDGFVGEAYTMRFIPAREDVNTPDPYRSGNTLQWETIENVPPGHVIVVDSRGDVSAASGGDMLMTRAMVRGAAGFVTDGACGTVMFSRTCRSPPTRGRSRSRRGRRPTTLLMCRRRSVVPGVAVYPGDVLVGDRDGVVVIPRAIAEEIADPSLAQEQMEAYLNTRIKGGEPLWGIYPPSDETKAQYEAWRATAADASGSAQDD